LSGDVDPIAVRKKLSIGSRRARFSVLSSGERQVLTLLFSATHMSSADGILLIDEPELSLHLDWQRTILTELMKQAGERQVVVCTHAPEVIADHRDSAVPLAAELWSPIESDVDDPNADDVE
jgi:predicted ATP-dependent endonuclease of OLD family